ncbi:MAG: NAD(P)-dependent oxidoreductase [Lachnospiraceae bacterium]|nr:NAD(P)-dependent oxidoreductase [Lachnospiraceae bacterium]
MADGRNGAGSKMKAIVTGATGFIGTALCRELLEKGHEVFAVVRPGSAKKEKLNFGEMTGGEGQGSRLHIAELPLEGLSELPVHIEGADVFYHLAWNGSAGAEREDFEIQSTNIRYTAEAVRAAVKCGCKKFVGAGSQAEYGVVREKAVEYGTVPQPFMMYGAAKLAAYHMGGLAAKKEGISFVWARIYSVYGMGENAGTLVSYVAGTLKKGGVPELSPCENMWNFLEITDCARALLLLGERQDTEGIYHVASQDTRLLKEFVKEMRDVIAPGSALGFGVKRSDPERTFWLDPDTGRLRELGFREEVEFEEGIRRKMCRDAADR